MRCFIASTCRRSLACRANPLLRDVLALIRYGLKPGEPGRPLEEMRRPFWRIPAGR